ncbi:uncharacterized protein LOC127837167 [Dreissena polymorpha]|uniref:Uncharacterized protein n=1 Tax=Dreissena polymorpha TaxID=45954 RepID=A0A9D4F770_DREPO|nr:uncharacterized protein LOC127837167 [Dreissena polymorpha]KAH3792541.1 hypothetical protein DPMN_146037 [Dreissena polymorpha]
MHASLNAYLEDNTKRCLEFISKLNEYGTKLKDNMSPERSFITLTKCLDQITATESLIKSMKQIDGVDIKLQPNRIFKECLEECTDLGKITSCIGEPLHDVDPNKIVSIQDISQYNVQTDNMNCNITGMCEAPNGEFVILDYTNCCVKLLDQAYRVVDQLKLPTPPWCMCNINLFEVAVTVSEYDADALNGIHFLLVDNRKIIKIKTFKMDHVCRGIAYHNTDLFVTSGTALYQYTIDGRLVEKLYEDSSGDNTVLYVGVRPDGKRIYVTDNANDKLLTLTRDGAVSVTLQDGALKHCYITANLHVAATGQVFVVGDKSISQVDTVGKTILNNKSLNIPQPASVYFNTHKRTLLVGFWNNDHIIEFKTTII